MIGGSVSYDGGDRVQIFLDHEKLDPIIDQNHILLSKI